MKHQLLITCLLLAICASVNAQVKGDSASAAGSKFTDSKSRHFWMGTNYRKEWNTPITVPLLNMSKENGGLKPVKRGGGKQTKSLRVEDASGRQYTLRSIQKFITSKTLPGDLMSEAAADLVSDGVSASYPYAALSIPTLAQAAGIPHGNPRVVFIGDDPALGEYREDFKNTMVLYEERAPDSVKKLYDTDEVADKLEDDNDNDIDQLALLRVRILDMFVMDLDRHEDQWSWGAYDNGKGKTFYPLAKDRDQAFYINQGLLPGLVKGRSLVPQLEGFKPDAKSIARFNFAARNLDRFFLNQLSEAEWKAEAERFLSKMTDEVIEKALAQQPKEIYAISAPKIIQILKDRRNYIVDDVMEYYRFISEIVSITGSDKKEQYTVTRNETGTVLVQVFKITKEGQPSTKMYERVFDPLVTKEVRIYGFDGDDQFKVFGTTDKIKVRLIGGGGQDAFESGPGGQKATLVYDNIDGGNTVKGRFKNNMSADSSVNSFQRIYYKYPYQSVFGTIGFNPDDGLLIGPTFKYTRHGFRKDPFKTSHQFKALFAFSTKAVNVGYHGEFLSVVGKNNDLVADVNYFGPNNTTNFFGYGMNSVYDKTKPNQFRFYRIRYDLGDIALQLRHRFSDKVMLYLGPRFQFYHYDSTDNLNKTRNVGISPGPDLNPATLYKRQGYFGATAMLSIDTRNSRALPKKGINWVTTFSSMSGTNKNSYDRVTQLTTDFAFYFELIGDERLVFADRVGGGITGGNSFEFFQAQYLGTNEYLRGFRRERFAGRSKFYNQAELRWKIANLKTYLFPAAIGVFAFVDNGRVWVKNDAVSKMATGYGGGVWFAPLRRIVLSVAYAMSNEDKLPVVRLGWQF